MAIFWTPAEDHPMPTRYQRRHYEQIAAILRTSIVGSDLYTREYAVSIVSMFADIFDKDNPAFDRPWFLAACEVS